MKTTVEQRRAVAKWVMAVIFALVVLWVVMLVTSCSSTVIPRPVDAGTVALEGNNQDAGVLSIDDQGAIITEHKKAEYDALVALYGRGTDAYAITPPVVPGAGLTRLDGAALRFPGHSDPVVWRIDREHLAWFVTFRKWQLANRPPR